MWAVLVWLSTPVPAAKFIGRPDHGNAIDLPEMPVIDLAHNVSYRVHVPIVEVVRFSEETTKLTLNHQLRALMKMKMTTT